MDLFGSQQPFPPGARIARLPAHQHRAGDARRRGAGGGEAPHGRRKGGQGAQHRHLSPWPSVAWPGVGELYCFLGVFLGTLMIWIGFFRIVS